MVQSGAKWILLSGCAGAVLMWMVDHSLLRETSDDGARRPVATVADGPPMQPNTRDPTRVSATPLDASAPAARRQTPEQQPARDAAVDTAVSEAGAEIAADPELALANGRLDPESSRPASLTSLLRTFSLECVFDPGYGVHWEEGQVIPGPVVWRGGPLIYETIDVEAGTAQLTGSMGSTGSVEGRIEQRVVATNTGLHFSGFNPIAELVVVSVFGAVDASGSYMAVMSRHGVRDNRESAQVYGSCRGR